MATRKISYEKAPCGRCGGSGSYSFNLRHGTVCYGCQGKGTQFSKLGKKAKKLRDAWVAQHLDLTAGGLVVGDVIEEVVVTGGGDVGHRWARVTEIREPGEGDLRSCAIVNGERVERKEIVVRTKSQSLCTSPEDKVRRKLRQDELDALGDFLRGTPGCEVIAECPRSGHSDHLFGSCSLCRGKGA